METSKQDFHHDENSTFFTTLPRTDNGATTAHFGDDVDAKHFFESTAVIALTSPKAREVSQLPNPKARINTMPYDVILLIFDRLSVCGQTCLGVTCRTLYDALKRQHPKPISLFHEVDCPGKGCLKWWHETHSDWERLGFYLQNWSGLHRVDYRLCKSAGRQHWVFVKRDVYGKNCDEIGNELRLGKRYEDYHLSQADNSRLRGPLLPNPFNEGKEWYAKAVAVIIADLDQPCGRRRPNDYKAWRDHWGMYSVFREKRVELK